MPVDRCGDCPTIERSFAGGFAQVYQIKSVVNSTMPKKGSSTNNTNNIKQWKSSPLSARSSILSAGGSFNLLDALEQKLPKLLVDDSTASSELDSISNNGSCSGESEDQQAPPSKEKAFIPGLEASPDKQDKIRLKNERKHQRHKERKTKEIKERCAGYLMSRKLDGLAQQLVSMGFPSERATMALILNEGDMERSITFLLEDGEIPKMLPKNANLKLDISDQLAKLEEIEARYGYPLAEIERAVVACEGDIDAARIWLRGHYTPGGQAAAAGSAPAAAPAAAPAVPRLDPQQQQQRQQQATKMIDTNSDSRLRPVASGTAPASVNGLKTVPLPPPPVWQRPPLHPLGGVAAAAAAAAAASAARLDPASLKFYEQSRELDVITDWRNSHQKALQQRYRRLEEPPHLVKPQLQQHFHHQLIQQQQHQQQQMIAPANLYHPHPLQQLVSISSPQQQQQHHRHHQQQQQSIQQSIQPPPWSSSNPSDSWDIPMARSVDYHAIDWSTGIPPSPFAKAAAATGSSVPRSMVRSDGWNRAETMQSGYRGLPEVSDLVSQEWTTPFAGKDLVHHQVVPSL